MVDIALVDNGILSETIMNKVILQKKFVDVNNYKIKGRDFIPIHGTTCAEIINAICSDVRFLDLVTTYADGTTDVCILIKVLEWCLQNKVKIIHMSLGSINYFDIQPLERIINRLTKNGIIIVAAYHNRNIRTYPAAFEKVFGVRQDRKGVLKENRFLFKQQSDLKVENSIVAHHWGSNGLERSNSFAAPVITGYIAKCLNKDPFASFETILSYLEEESDKEFFYPFQVERVFKNKTKIDIPILGLYGFDQMKCYRIVNCFETKGYSATLLQEDSQISFGIPIEYYQQRDNSYSQVLCTLKEIYEPDIILWNKKNEKKYKSLGHKEIDAYIEFENGMYFYEDSDIKMEKTSMSEIIELMCSRF